MASSPIEIPIASETKAFKQGIDSGVIAPLEDAQDALDALGKSRGPDQLERDLNDASKTSEKLKRQTQETADAIERDYKDAYRSMKVASRDATTEAGEDIRNFKDEARQNLSEFTSSFTGDLDDLASGVQGLTGGLAAALTPGVGIPVAILGAAAATFLTSWITATDETKERVNSMFDDLSASNQAFLSEDFITSNLTDIIKDDAKRQKAVEDAKKLGLEVGTVLRATAGDAAAVNEVIARGNKLREAELDTIRQSGESVEQQENRLDGVNVKYDEILDTYVDINGESQKALDGLELMRQATGRAATADQERYEALGRHIAGLPTEVPVSLKLDTTEFDRRLNDYKNKRLTINADVLDRKGRPVP